MILKHLYRLSFILALSVCFTPAISVAAVIKSIVVSGNKKIEKDAILAKLTSKVGSQLKSAQLQSDIRALFETGYFYDVVISESKVSGGVRLSYKLVEKPNIISVEFVGNDEVDDDELAEIAEIKAYQILDNATISAAIAKIEKTYEDKGFFLARVKSEITPVNKGESVQLKFTISENDKVVVKRVQFLGNSKLDTNLLKSRMITKEGGFFSFISGSGAYKQDAFDRDVQVIGYLYRNEGYVQAKVDRPQVYVSPDKKGIYITIRVDEGEQFKVGQVDFAGDLMFTDDELREAIQLEKDNVFSLEKIQGSVLGLTAKYGDLGYAYANPIPRTRVNEKDKIVDVTFDIDKGNKVYIGNINVVGNTKTRDKVVRRELRLREGELYNETRRRESVANVQRLGFFEEVIFNTKTPNNRPDIMDIEIKVKERNTGQVQVGAGFSSLDGLVFNGQLKEINFLGRGQNLGVSVDWSNQRKNITLNYTEPYFKDTEWEVGVQAYLRDRDLPEYNEKKTGGGFSVGHPLAPYFKGVIGYKLDDTVLTLPSTGADADLFPVETANGITSSVTMSLIYDKRNDRFAPSKGIYSRAFLEYAGIGGDLNYTKGGANFRYYKKIFWDVVWRNNFDIGFVSSNDSNKPVPFNELFLLGGSNTLRGYDFFSVGRRKFSKVASDAAIANGSSASEAAIIGMRPFGGRQRVYYNLEFQFPLIKEAGILGVVFYDIGYADNSILLEDLRSDFGFGFRWFSPIGPLRFEWGFPVDPQKDLQESQGPNFQFSIGTPF